MIDAKSLFDTYAIRGLKSHQGRDTLAFRGTLYEHGAPIGTVSNEGRGGSHDIDFTRAAGSRRTQALTDEDLTLIRQARQRFSDATAQLTPYQLYSPDHTGHPDDLVDLLIERVQMDRKARTHTILRRDLSPTESQLCTFNARLTGALLVRAVTDHVPPERRADTMLWVTGRGWVALPRLLGGEITVE